MIAAVFNKNQNEDTNHTSQQYVYMYDMIMIGKSIYNQQHHGNEKQERRLSQNPHLL